MEKTMNIEGMMCMHCEAAVKKALEEIDGEVVHAGMKYGVGDFLHEKVLRWDEIGLRSG